MSPPKFLADEHIDLAAVRALKKEVDIDSVQEVGIRGKDDKILIKHAREENRVIITKDTDFLKENKKGTSHTGIVFLTKHLEVGELIKEVKKISLLYSREELQDTVVFIPV